MLVEVFFHAGVGQGVCRDQRALATSTDVRAVAEMNDGTLYSVSKHVRVTISGCDLPPQG